MDLKNLQASQTQVDNALTAPPAVSEVVTLFYTDVADVNALKDSLGVQDATAEIRKLHEYLRDKLQSVPQAQEIDSGPDSILITFAKPSEAVQFGLGIQSQSISKAQGRLGINLGEVQRPNEAKAKERFGLHLDACAQLMQMARPNQILMSRAVFDTARQVLKSDESTTLAWSNHGTYVLSDIDETIEVCEVASGDRTLQRPQDSGVAQRKVTSDEESTLGWRPGGGLAIPGRQNWQLQEQLGEGGDLMDWSKDKGGIQNLPLETRLEIVAQSAVALAAAHSVGVLHKDSKPANILIAEQPGSGQIRASLTDFGISLITDRQLLSEKGITATGLTMTMMEAGGASSSGTCLCMTPELIEGKPATTLSDVYALGVVLYQIVIGDFQRSIAPGWERDVQDECLREDIGACVDGLPERRLASATGLATRLRSMDQRRERLQAERESKAQLVRADRRRRQYIGFSIVGFVLTIGIAIVAFREFQLRHEADNARREAEYGRYISEINVAKANLDQDNNMVARQALLNARPEYRDWEWGVLANQAWPPQIEIDPERILNRDPEVSVSDFWASGSVRVIKTLDHGRHVRISGTVFNQQGTAIATTSTDGTIRLWDVQTGELAYRFPPLGSIASAVAFSHNDQLVTAGQVGGDTSLLDIQTKEVLWTQSASGAIGISAFWFTADDSILAVAYFDGSVGLFQTEAGQLINTFSEHSKTVGALRFLPDGQSAMSSSLDGSIRIWDFETGSEIQDTKFAPTLSEKGISAQEFDPTNPRIVATSDWEGVITLWNWETDEKRQLHTSDQPIHDLLFSHDGTCLFVVTRKSVRILDTTSAEQKGPAMGPIADARIYASSDGSRVVTSSRDGTSRIWAPVRRNPESGRTLADAHNDFVLQAAFSTDCTRIVTASYDKTLRIWDADTQELIQTFEGHEHELLKAEFSQDGKQVASLSSRGKLQVWNVETERKMYSIQADTNRFLRAAASGRGLRYYIVGWSAGFATSPFTHSGDRLLANDAQDMVVVDSTNGRELLKLADNPAIGWPVIGPLDRRVATKTDRPNDVHLWDLETGKKLRVLSGHDRQAFWVAFSPDGSRLVTDSMDNTAIVWDVSNGTQLVKLEGHEGAVGFARFSPDGTRIATASPDTTARIWDASTGTLLSTFTGHPDRLSNVEFNPKGNRMLTTGQDDTVRIWDPEGPVARELVSLTHHSRLLYGT